MVSSSPTLPQRPPARVAPSATVLPWMQCPETPPHRSPSTQPRWAKPPWKSLWKGPLPPARISTPATLGDYQPPVLQSLGGRGAAGATDALDPVPSAFQFLETPIHNDQVQSHQQPDNLSIGPTCSLTTCPACALFAWLISHQSAVLFSQNKPASAISHQTNEQADSY
jgi:hypothetical protein